MIGLWNFWIFTNVVYKFVQFFLLSWLKQIIVTITCHRDVKVVSHGRTSPAKSPFWPCKTGKAPPLDDLTCPWWPWPSTVARIASCSSSNLTQDIVASTLGRGLRKNQRFSPLLTRDWAWVFRNGRQSLDRRLISNQKLFDTKAWNKLEIIKRCKTRLTESYKNWRQTAFNPKNLLPKMSFREHWISKNINFLLSNF